MAYAEKRGKGEYPWRARFKLPDGTYGTEPGFRTEKAAVDHGNEQEADIRRGTWRDPNRGRRLFSDWVTAWIKGQDLDGVTLDVYRSRLKNHLLPRWADTYIADIAPNDVEIWAREMAEAGCAASSIKAYRSLLATILEDAVSDGIIQTNPARPRARRGKWTKPAAADEKVWCTPADVLRVANNARVITGEWAYVLILLAAYTGMRWGELVGLERQYVQADGSVVDVRWQLLARSDGTFEKKPPKYGSYRLLPLPPSLAAILAAFLKTLPDDQEYVFLTAAGSHPRNGWFSTGTLLPAIHGRAATVSTRGVKPWLPAVPGADGLTPHGWRHGQKVWIDEDGAPEVAAAARMGHRMRGMKGLYSHVSEAMVKAIVRGLERRFRVAVLAVAKDVIVEPVVPRTMVPRKILSRNSPSGSART